MTALHGRTVLALGLLAACGQVLKPADPDRRLDVHMTGGMFEVGTGYRVVVLPEPASSVLRLIVRYPVGGADDPPGKAGLAHVVAHVLEAEKSVELGRLALAWNAVTEADATTYEVTAVPGALDELLGLEVAHLAPGCAGVAPESFERARQAVLGELRQRDGAAAQLQEVIREQAYPPGHPYRAVATADSVANVTLPDACAFLAGPYQRGTVTVVASGAVDEPALRAVAAQRFGKLAERAPSTRPAVAPVVAQHARARAPGPVDEPTLVVTWPLPQANTRDYRLLSMLWRAIPYDLAAASLQGKWGHAAHAQLLGGPRAPVLALSVALTSANKLDEATAAIATAIKAAAHELGDADGGEWGHTEDWRDHWQGQAEDVLARWESLQTRNELFAEILDDETGPGSLATRIAELSAATPDRVRALGATWLDPARGRYLLVEPSPGAGPHAPLTPSPDASEEQGLDADPALADHPAAIPAQRPTLVIHHDHLANGLELLLVPGGSSALVHARLVVAAGTAHEPNEKDGIAAFVGAADTYPDNLVFTGRDLSSRVDEMLLSTTLALRQPTYHLSDHDKAVLRARLVRAAARDYRRDLAVGVYGEAHPYARPSLDEDRVDQLGGDAVGAWEHTEVVPANSTLVVTGRFDPALAKQWIKYYVDQAARGSHAPDIAAAPEPARRFVRGVDSKPASTVQLDVEFRGGQGLDAGYGKRLVLAAVLAARLDTLRGAALTSPAAVGYEPRAAGGLWRLSGEADAARAGEAATAMAAILADVRRDPQSYRHEFIVARQRVVEGLLVGLCDSREVANRLTLMARFHLPDTYFDQLVQDVAALTLPDLQALIAAELPAEHEVFGAFGSAAAVDAALAAAKAAP